MVRQWVAAGAGRVDSQSCLARFQTAASDYLGATTAVCQARAPVESPSACPVPAARWVSLLSFHPQRVAIFVVLKPEHGYDFFVRHIVALCVAVAVVDVRLV